ncbi:BREX system serine/threonine kinase PglW [Hamadaea sp. NPDC051192]|uniref:BREX system serine/threonine kinase PglW n=1 Tax=Hamadaea sp. NPDC051192 TaxID=3154940 RepID=UPI0034280E0D
MREDSPRWEHINPSQFVHEQSGLRQLASYLPDTDPYHVWANVEFVGTDGSINEVDALVLTPRGLFVLELKHWSGEIGGDGIQWVRRPPNGRLTPEDNPYILANRKAKRLASVIKFYARQQGKEAHSPFVGAAVYLHAPDFRSRLDEIGRQHVFGPSGHPGGLPSLQEFLLSGPARPEWLITADRGRQIVDLVRGAKIRPSVADRRILQLILHPAPFAEGVGWQDFLAGHELDPGLVRRVRFYLTSRAPAEEVPIIQRGAEREFRLLQGIHHPGIAHPVDKAEHSFGPALIFDHAGESVRLDQWLTQRERERQLTVAQKLHLVQDLAEIVDYAHSRRLSHRALHPRAVFVTEPDRSRPALLITDWQTGGRLVGTTQITRLSSSSDGAGLELFLDDEIRRYQAPEAFTSAQVPGIKLDVFGLGAIAYRIFAGRPPADSADQLVAKVRNRGLNLAGVVDGMPNNLVKLLYDATHGDPAQRLASVGDFRRGLEDVWDELTAPEPEPVKDPLEAVKGDILDGGLRVERRLGSGATATALLVTRGDGDSRRELVLKVARDEQHADRLTAEAQAVGKLKHWQVAALVDGPVTVGGRTALLLESAGPRTLAEELQKGRLAIDLLERYGRDLLDVVGFLDGQGVWHRDLKPTNLAARPRPKDKQLHLCVFDFSLASTPADHVTAGTPPYLDPFLGEAGRSRYDAAAERFAAAVTLYEMATGTVPRWGDNANPATVSNEVTLEASAFDTAVADRLINFFAKAMARDANARFDTVEEMTDAWRAIFRDIPDAAASVTQPSGAVTFDTQLIATDLTARARSALERLGVHTVGELLAYEPSALTRAKGVPDATRKEILALARTLRPLIGNQRPVPAPETVTAHGIEAVCATLLDGRSRKEHLAMRVLLGQEPTAAGVYLCWPAQSEAARSTGHSQPQISNWLRKYAPKWLENAAVAQVRDEIVALLDTRGSIMSAEEVAEALLATRGSYAADALRLPQAIGLVRAAVEAELARGGDARVAIRRFQSSDTVLIGREPDDPASLTTAASLLDYAALLGQRAKRLAAIDPLPSRQRAVDDLRAVPSPDGLPAMTDQRLLEIAVAASNNEAALSAQGILYPVGMPADRALRLAANALVVPRLPVEDLQSRVQARFPLAEPLPGMPELGRLVTAIGLPLQWDAVARAFTPETMQSSATSTRMATFSEPLTTRSGADEVGARLAVTIEQGRYLALLTSLRTHDRARRELLARLDMQELDVTAVLLARLRALGFPWEAIIAADSGNPKDPDFRGLTELVQHHVVPTLAEALSAPDPLLITEAAPLARYGALRVLQELADPTRPRPAARILLLPSRRPDPAMLDHVQVPLTSPGTQTLWLPDAWLDRVA